jgi:large subunit ribosomal protein L11
MEIKNLKEIDISKVVRSIDLVIPAQSAKLSQPVGPMLGQVKIKIKDFCNSFNETTNLYEPELPLKVIVFIYKNDSFNYIVKSPSTTFLIKNYYLLNEKNGVSLLDLYKVMLIKHQELKLVSKKLIFRNILILTKLMKIKIIN